MELCQWNFSILSQVNCGISCRHSLDECRQMQPYSVFVKQIVSFTLSMEANKSGTDSMEPRAARRWCIGPRDLYTDLN
jgi:hypothetical protein